MKKQLTIIAEVELEEDCEEEYLIAILKNDVESCFCSDERDCKITRIEIANP